MTDENATDENEEELPELDEIPENCRVLQSGEVIGDDGIIGRVEIDDSERIAEPEGAE